MDHQRYWDYESQSLAAMLPKEKDMSVKGLKEALAKKQASQKTAQNDTDPEIKTASPRSGRVAGNKPMKKAAGRGR